MIVVRCLHSVSIRDISPQRNVAQFLKQCFNAGTEQSENIVGSYDGTTKDLCYLSLITIGNFQISF